VDHPGRDTPIPGVPYGFAQLIAAQADGDRDALRARGRPVIRVDDWSALRQEIGR
jgi:glucose-6-phosphate isomerase